GSNWRRRQYMTSIQEPVTVREPIAAAEEDLAALRKLRTLLAESKEGPPLIVGGEHEVAIPPPLLYLLRGLVEHLANERAVRMETFGKEVTPWEAADILGDPIEHVWELIDDGTLLAREVNGDRAVNLRLIKRSDVLKYLHERSKQRHEALRELTRLSEE